MKAKKNIDVPVMENHILKEVAFITESYLGKGLCSVAIERLKSSSILVVLSFKDENRITRVRISIDDSYSYVVSVVNPDKELVFMTFCKYDSDFNAVLYHQCSNLAELPF